MKEYIVGFGPDECEYMLMGKKRFTVNTFPPNEVSDCDSIGGVRIYISNKKALDV